MEDWEAQIFEQRPVGRGCKAQTAGNGTESIDRDVPTINMTFPLI
jgi:hypothetical protein